MATLSLLPQGYSHGPHHQSRQSCLCLQKGFYEMVEILHVPPVQKLRAGKES